MYTLSSFLRSIIKARFTSKQNLLKLCLSMVFCSNAQFHSNKIWANDQKTCSKAKNNTQNWIEQMKWTELISNFFQKQKWRPFNSDTVSEKYSIPVKDHLVVVQKKLFLMIHKGKFSYHSPTISVLVTSPALDWSVQSVQPVQEWTG